MNITDIAALRKKIFTKRHLLRFIACAAGNTFMGFGVALATFTSLGTDPFNSMCMAVSAFIGIEYTAFTPLFNCGCFVFEILWGRKYIGAGTFINWFLLCYAVDFFLSLFRKTLPEGLSFPVRLLLLLAALVIISFGLAMYQRADLGVAPYDAIPLMVCRRFGSVPFFAARVSLDALAVLAALLCGGKSLVGVGTVLTAFCLGPVVQMFTSLFDRLLGRFSGMGGAGNREENA